MVVNLVLRDQSLRFPILNGLKPKFKTIISYQLEGDLNEILICWVNEVSEEIIKEGLGEAGAEINSFFKRNNCDDSLDLDRFLKKLTMVQ